MKPVLENRKMCRNLMYIYIYLRLWNYYKIYFNWIIWNSTKIMKFLDNFYLFLIIKLPVKYVLSKFTSWAGENGNYFEHHSGFFSILQFMHILLLHMHFFSLHESSALIFRGGGYNYSYFYREGREDKALIDRCLRGGWLIYIIAGRGGKR